VVHNELIRVSDSKGIRGQNRVPSAELPKRLRSWQAKEKPLWSTGSPVANSWAIGPNCCNPSRQTVPSPEGPDAFTEAGTRGNESKKWTHVKMASQGTIDVSELLGRREAHRK